MARYCVLAGIILWLTGVAASAGQLEPVQQPANKAAMDIRSDDGTILISADQVQSYDWATHTLTLAPKVREQLAADLMKTKRLVGGVPFTIAVDGKAVYRGKFTTSLSSIPLDTPVIVIHAPLDPTLGPDQLRIQLGYPGPNFFKGQDPRGDARVREALRSNGKLTKVAVEHTEWLAKALREMQTIKVGMTRADLLNVFEEEGGLSTRTQRRYAYRGCVLIRVDVTFEAVGPLAGKLVESPKDRISKISAPFLDWPISD